MDRKIKLYFLWFLVMGITIKTLERSVYSWVRIPNHIECEMVNLVEEVKSIQMPFMYRCYNPGVVEDGTGYLVVTRCDRMGLMHSLRKKVGRDRRSYFISFRLDQSFNQVSPLELVKIAKSEGYKEFSPNDPRLFVYGEKTYVLFNDHDYLGQERVGDRAMYLGELIEDKSGPKLIHVRKLNFPESEEYYNLQHVSYRCEKNWTPLVKNDELYLIYLLDPLVVLSVDPTTGDCKRSAVYGHEQISPFGLARGGTPLVETEKGFLSLYHLKQDGSQAQIGPFRTNEKGGYYFGAYLLSKEYPFNLEQRMSKLISGPSLYNGRKKIEYPTALIDKGDKVVVFWGHEDQWINVGTIQKEKLWDYLY